MNGTPRDRAFECELTSRISGEFVSADAINRHAQGRSDSLGDDISLIPVRDFVLETLEELSDARNYIVWQLQLIHLNLLEDDGQVELLQTALRSVVFAFEELRKAWRPRS